MSLREAYAQLFSILLARHHGQTRNFFHHLITTPLADTLPAGFMMLGMPAIKMLEFFPVGLLNREKYLSVHTAAKVLGTVNDLYSRVYYYFPTAYNLLKFAFAQEDMPSPWK